MKILSALKAGQSLDNPGLWKKAQNWINLITAILSAITAFMPSLSAIATPEVIKLVVSIVGAINVYLTTATTEKIGF
jgi:VIT1/CCC1 family predicted Fe2+/Mn2+ transporter